MATANNSITQVQEDKKKLTFAAAMQTTGYQKLVNGTLRDSKRANRFVAAVTAAVTANPLLNKCAPDTILSAAFQGEALELSPSPTLGEYYLVPYKKKRKNANGEWEEVYEAQFQLGTAGRIQLAMRTGQYKDLGAIEIREGEYLGRNKENGKPQFEFVTDDIEREKLPIIGYLGYFTLLNGFSHSEYFSLKKCIDWADRYSKSFDRKLYEKIKAGKDLDWKEQQAATAPWYAHTDVMCKNLVLRQALKIAPKSIEMRNLLEEGEETELSTVVSDTITPQQAENDFFNGTEGEVVEEPAPTTKAKKPSTKQTTVFDGGVE